MFHPLLVFPSVRPCDSAACQSAFVYFGLCMLLCLRLSARPYVEASPSSTFFWIMRTSGRETAFIVCTSMPSSTLFIEITYRYCRTASSTDILCPADTLCAPPLLFRLCASLLFRICRYVDSPHLPVSLPLSIYAMLCYAMLCFFYGASSMIFVIRAVDSRFPRAAEIERWALLPEVSTVRQAQTFTCKKQVKCFFWPEGTIMKAQ